MKMFKDYYEEDYDPIEEYEKGVRLLHMDEDYEDRHDYERGIKPFHDYDTEDTDDDDYGPCIRHFRD